MKTKTLVPIGVLLLAGLGWILTRDGGRGTPNAPVRAERSAEAGETAPLERAPDAPYAPPGIAEREPEPRTIATAPESATATATAPANEPPPRDPTALLERDRAIALDRGKSLDERVRAIRNLQTYKVMDDLEGRTSDVIAEAAWILEYADDPDVREDLLQGLQGLDDPAVVAPLARALIEDLDPQVREAAAEALREHRADPAAASALQRAAAEDGDERVRVAAAKTR
jgi:hypothetical protein